MVAEVYAGLSAFKTLFDLAKGLKDIDDAARRNSAVIELQEKILDAQAAQAATLERISQLEKEVAEFKEWEAEKQRYELKDLGWGALAYMLKAEARGTEPPHAVCTNCFGQRRISIIQNTMIRGEGRRHVCPACQTRISPSDRTLNGDNFKWLD